MVQPHVGTRRKAPYLISCTSLLRTLVWYSPSRMSRRRETRWAPHNGPPTLLRKQANLSLAPSSRIYMLAGTSHARPTRTCHGSDSVQAVQDQPVARSCYQLLVSQKHGQASRGAQSKVGYLVHVSRGCKTARPRKRHTVEAELFGSGSRQVSVRGRDASHAMKLTEPLSRPLLAWFEALAAIIKRCFGTVGRKTLSAANAACTPLDLRVSAFLCPLEPDWT